MATPTYDLLDSVTLSSSASSVTFSSIDQSYRDLVLVINYTTTFNGANITLNNDTGSTNYTSVYMRGDGSSASSGTNTGVAYFLQTFCSSTGGNHIIQLLDYSATDKHKTGLSRFNYATAITGRTEATAARWANTAAITEIDLIGLAANEFPAATSFHLYGIAS